MQVLQRTLLATRAAVRMKAGSSASSSESYDRAKASSESPPASDVEGAKSGPEPQNPKQEEFHWKGASLPKMAAVVAVGLLIRFIPWKPAQLTDQVVDTDIAHRIACPMLQGVVPLCSFVMLL